MTGSLLRARQRALTAILPHNANKTHAIPNRGVTGVGGGISHQGDHLLLESAEHLFLEDGATELTLES